MCWGCGGCWSWLNPHYVRRAYPSAAPDCLDSGCPSIALPSPRPGFSQPDADLVRDGLARLEGLPTELADITVFAQGHSAGLAALAAAAEKLQNGASDACLIGGVDSYFHPDTLGWLDEHRQLAGGESRSGFVPGEGACFFLNGSEPARPGGAWGP